MVTDGITNDTTSEATTKEKHRAVGRSIATIKKKYSLPEDTMVITTADKLEPVEKAPTGVLSIDLATEGGFDYGRFAVLSGDVGSGKTTLCLRTLAQAQAAGKTCIFVDAEHRFDPRWAIIQGVNVEELQLLQPMGASQEAVLDAVRSLCIDKAADMIIVDSATSLSGGQELERSLAQDTMALSPRIFSQFFRMTVGSTRKSKVCGLLICQRRDTMNQYARKMDGITGGRALKHYPQYIVNTSSKAYVEGVGFTMGVELLKATGPGQSVKVEVPFRYDIGIDVVSDLVNVSIKKGLIGQGGGGFYTVKKEITGGDEERIRGQENLLGWIQGKGLEEKLRKLLVAES